MEEVEGDFEWLDISAEDPSGGILRKILICYGVAPPPGRDPSDEYRSILIAIAPRSGFDDMTRYQQGWVLSFRADNRLYRVHRSGRRVTVPAANGCNGFPA